MQRARSATDTSTSQRISARYTGVTRVRVRAKNSNGNGAWAFGSGTALRQGPPTDLRVTAGNGRLTLTWTAPAGDLGPYELAYTSAPKSGNGAVADTAVAFGSDDTRAWVRTSDDPLRGCHLVHDHWPDQRQDVPGAVVCGQQFRFPRL